MKIIQAYLPTIYIIILINYFITYLVFVFDLFLFIYIYLYFIIFLKKFTNEFMSVESLNYFDLQIIL